MCKIVQFKLVTYYNEIHMYVCVCVHVGLSSKTRQPQSAEVQNALNERPSSKLATVWMGTDTGV